MNHLVIDNIPIKIKVGNKLLTLSMNQDRNRHHYLKNKLKQDFAKLIQLPEQTCIFEQAKLEYTLYYNSHRRIDLMNLGAIVDKYTQDVLVQHNIIKDDSLKCVKQVTFKLGMIDKSITPHFKLVITDYV